MAKTSGSDKVKNDQNLEAASQMSKFKKALTDSQPIEPTDNPEESAVKSSIPSPLSTTPVLTPYK